LAGLIQKQTRAGGKKLFDHFQEECGVVGIYGHPEASNLVYLALYALQHRGQESAGIVSADRQHMYSHRAMGLVQDVFNEDIIKRLPGHLAIGHVRYSTTGASFLKNAQPFAMETNRLRLALAHNGNLVNAREIREELENEHGAIFQSSSDSEVIAHLIASVRSDSLLERISSALSRLQGAFSLVFLTEKTMVGARDPWGFRPLVLGKFRKRDGYVIASETCALDLIEADYVREIEPGEILLIDDNGIQSFQALPTKPLARCIFEHIYFARPDSLVFGESVYQARIRLGKQLAIEHPVDADMVISVPDSGRIASYGFAHQAGLPVEEGLIRNHYVGRTFIEPSHSIRHFGVKLKLNAVRDVLKGKRVVVVDDSIVRGTTCLKLITMLREQGGAKEVHMRISSPPTAFSCFYGVDTPTREELAYNAFNESVENIRRFINADSLGYISRKGLHLAVNSGKGGYCDACFSGEYPVPFPESIREKQMKLFLREIENR
jgi:amidophosphoribosyltransferase